MRLIVSSLLILICLTGCFRHCYRSYPYSLCQTQLEGNVQQAFEQGSCMAGEICQNGWWEFFEDSQLNTLMASALSSYPDLHIADARIRLAFQEAMVARSALFPHLFGVADVQRKKISKLGEGFVPGLPTLYTLTTLKLATAIYELDIWKKNRSLYYAALDVMQARRAEYEEAKLLLTTTLAAVYFDLQMKWARHEVTQKRLEARQEQYALLKQQFTLGIISEFRLYEMDTAVQLLRDFLKVLEGEIAADQHALVALAGRGICVKPMASFKHPFPLPASLPIDLLARRPDVTARKWLVEAACFGVIASQANFFPKIDLLGWIGFQSILIEKLFRGDTLIALGEGSATLPLFLAGKLEADLGIAHERVEIAVGNYNLAILNAVNQVSDALTDLQTADDRKKALDKALQDSEALLSLTQQKYDHGVINKVTLLNAKENVFVQEDLQVQIQLDRFESAVDLIKAIGGGYYDHTCF